jgi:hypothetical protein
MPRVLENGDRRVLEDADLNVRVPEDEVSALVIAQIMAQQAVKRSSEH